jgi:Zn-finger nucleic acid-binding protein
VLVLPLEPADLGLCIVSLEQLTQPRERSRSSLVHLRRRTDDVLPVLHERAPDDFGRRDFEPRSERLRSSPRIAIQENRRARGRIICIARPRVRASAPAGPKSSKRARFWGRWGPLRVPKSCGTVFVSEGGAAMTASPVTHADLEPMCPRCNLALTSLQEGSARLCRACAGIWFPRAEYRAVLDDLSSGMRCELAERARGAGDVDCSAPVDCPICSSTMTRRRVTDRSVEIDVCRAHGVWFDKGELNRVALWVYEKRERKRKRVSGESEPVSREWFDLDVSAGSKAFWGIIDSVLHLV